MTQNKLVPLLNMKVTTWRRKVNLPKYRFNHPYKEGTLEEINIFEQRNRAESCHRRDLMNKIGCLIIWFYDHGAKILPILAKVYPRYEWRTFLLTNTVDEEILHLLKTNDFIWLYQHAIVVARSRRKRRNFHSVCWYSRVCEIEDETEVKKLKENCEYFVESSDFVSW